MNNIGKTFGDMTIIKKLDKRHGHQYYLVKCNICGKEKENSIDNLKRGRRYNSQYYKL